ncbi:MAG: NADH-quinone oxidoreductase subunit C [Candidatus Heimdallarchaeaceae archaeon]
MEQKKDNTTKEKEISEKLSSKLKHTVNIQGEKRLEVIVNPTEIVFICSQAYEMGFNHLSTISVTDWLEKGIFEMTYHLWSYIDNVLLTIKCNIDRKKPTIASITSIWGANAEVCERECHEFFGVVFEGNSNLTPLFLEDWQGPAPFRKDFDWREYVRKEFYDKANPREEPYFEVKK